MSFFNSAVDVLQTLVIALGAGLAIWGAINLLEGYGNDNPGAKSQGIKQLMAGGGVALIDITLVPLRPVRLMPTKIRSASSVCRGAGKEVMPFGSHQAADYRMAERNTG